MAEMCNLFFPPKGKKIVLTWIENNFKPKLLGTSDLELLESPLFKTDESVYKIRLIPWYIECPDRLACLLMKVDPVTLPFALYLIDVEVKIDSKTWNATFSPCSDYLYAPLMDVLELRDGNKFPPECKLTVKLVLRRCMYSKPCSRYASATTEFSVTTTSRNISFKDYNSSQMQHESIEEIARNEFAANEGYEVVSNGISIDSRCLHWEIERPDGADFYRIILGTGGLSLFVKCEINLVDVRSDIVISSFLEKRFISESENYIVEMPVPSIFLEEFENSSAAFEKLNCRLIVSNYSEKQTIKTSESARFYYFSVKENKCPTIDSDLKNFYHNTTQKSDFCIKAGKKMFAVHRDILASRSPVFKAMLQHDMVESRTGVLEIEEMNQEELKIFLKFLYTSELEMNIGFEIAASLYTAADKYGILNLLPICRRKLIDNISITNFDYLFILSYLHRDREMKESIRSFLVPRYFNSEVFSYLDNIFMFDRPLTDGVIEFLRSLKNRCSSMSINNDP